MASTAPIRDLMHDALDRLEQPFTEDVIDDVFYAIETTPDLRKRYDALCAERAQTVVNTWGGWWIGNVVERRGLREVKAQRSRLIGQYSKLDQPAVPRLRLRKKKIEAAGDEVYVYYRENKAAMPNGIAKMRDEITAMVADGTPVDQAFEIAIRLLSS